MPIIFNSVYYKGCSKNHVQHSPKLNDIYKVKPVKKTRIRGESALCNRHQIVLMINFMTGSVDVLP